jgi:hypothetical protein
MPSKNNAAPSVEATPNFDLVAAQNLVTCAHIGLEGLYKLIMREELFDNNLPAGLNGDHLGALLMPIIERLHGAIDEIEAANSNLSRTGGQHG